MEQNRRKSWWSTLLVFLVAMAGAVVTSFFLCGNYLNSSLNEKDTQLALTVAETQRLMTENDSLEIANNRLAAVIGRQRAVLDSLEKEKHTSINELNYAGLLAKGRRLMENGEWQQAADAVRQSLSLVASARENYGYSIDDDGRAAKALGTEIDHLQTLESKCRNWEGQIRQLLAQHRYTEAKRMGLVARKECRSIDPHQFDELLLDDIVRAGIEYLRKKAEALLNKQPLRKSEIDTAMEYLDQALSLVPEDFTHLYLSQVYAMEARLNEFRGFKN